MESIYNRNRDRRKRKRNFESSVLVDLRSAPPVLLEVECVSQYIFLFLPDLDQTCFLFLATKD